VIKAVPLTTTAVSSTKTLQKYGKIIFLNGDFLKLFENQLLPVRKGFISRNLEDF